MQRKRRVVAALGLTALVGAVGYLTAGSLAGGATRTSATVSLRTTSLGPILVDSRGHTLYLFAKDRNGKSACTASCAKYWPPLLSGSKPTAGAGVKASLLATIKRGTGSQVTYNRHPLYTYVLDRRAGQTSGQGRVAFGARWHAVSAKGTAVIRPPATATTTTAETTTTTRPYP